MDLGGVYTQILGTCIVVGITFNQRSLVRSTAWGAHWRRFESDSRRLLLASASSAAGLARGCEGRPGRAPALGASGAARRSARPIIATTAVFPRASRQSWARATYNPRYKNGRALPASPERRDRGHGSHRSSVPKTTRRPGLAHARSARSAGTGPRGHQLPVSEALNEPARGLDPGP